MTLHTQIRGQLLNALSQPHSDETAQLNNALRFLSKWRSHLIQNTLLQHQGTRVLNGPLKDLEFLPNSTEGCHIPKLLGCYEEPLQPYIEQAIQTGYPTLLNIGCAEGYYAVGLARRMPHTRVFAFDLNPTAQETCTALAQKNKVEDRVTIGGLFNTEDFASFANQKLLLLCDIEGAEKELLNPEKAPDLSRMDMIVESHECLIPGVTRLLMDRFRPTHEMILVEDNGQRKMPHVPAWFNNLAHLDQLLALWEWRSGATPWLVLRAKTGASPK
jgi:hypothetical protein